MATNPLSKYITPAKPNAITSSLPKSPTYNPSTNVYTDSSGKSSSRSPANVPVGTTVVGSSSGGSHGRSGGLGSSGTGVNPLPQSKVPTQAQQEQMAVNKALVANINQQLFGGGVKSGSQRTVQVGRQTINLTTGKTTGGSSTNTGLSNIDYSKRNQIDFNFDPGYMRSRNIRVIRNKEIPFKELSKADQEQVKSDFLKNQTVVRVNADGTKVYANQKQINNALKNLTVTQTSENTYRPNSELPFSYSVTTQVPGPTTFTTTEVNNNEIKPFTSKDYFSSLGSTAKERYVTPYVTPIKSGFQQIGRGLKSGYASDDANITKQNLMIGLSNLGKGTKKVGTKALKVESTIGKGYETIFSNPKQAKEDFLNAERLIGTKIKSTVLYKGSEQIGRGLVSKEQKKITREQFATGGKMATTPESLAKTTLLIGEVMLPLGISKGVSASRGVALRTVGKEVPIESIASRKALAENSMGLDLTFNPKKTLEKFKTSEKRIAGTELGKIQEFKGKQIGFSGASQPLSSKTVLTKTQLRQPMSETGGQFVSPIGYGQPYFFGVKNKSYKLKLGINPFKGATTERPTGYIIGVKKVKEYPESLLARGRSKKDIGALTNIENFQKSRVGKSEAYITRESSLGIKTEPEATIPVGTRYQSVKSDWRPLYTKYKGKTIPLKTYIPEEKEILSSFKIKSKPSKPISGKSFNKMLKQSEEYYSGRRNIPVNYPLSSIRYKSNSSKLSSLNSSTVSSSTGNSSFAKRVESSVPRRTSESAKSTSSTSSKLTTSERSSFSPSERRTTSSTTSERRKTTPSERRDVTGGSSERRTTDTGRTPSPTYARPNSKKGAGGFIPSPNYDAYVKIKGKNVKINKEKNLNFKQASAQGLRLADNTTARSFLIKKGKNVATFNNSMPPNINKFYRPSKQGNPKLTGFYIEKNKYAIDTKGEKKGLKARNFLRGFKI